MDKYDLYDNDDVWEKAFWDQYLFMDGYADYVWSAYGITIFIIIFMISSSIWKHRRVKKEEQKLSKIK